MKKQFFLVLAALFGVIGLNTVRADYQYPTGAVRGVFTVDAEGKKVAFSQGNLQYYRYVQVVDGKEIYTFRFAPKQVDYKSTDNISQTCGLWWDVFLFGSGKSPESLGGSLFGLYCGDAPLESDVPARRKAPLGDELFFNEWGDNLITNGGEYSWRTLTADEWRYIFLEREGARNKFGFATIDGTNGLVVLPDDWNSPAGCSFEASSKKMTELPEGGYAKGDVSPSVYSHNTYNAATWKKMEAAGAVFMPAAGMRQGNMYNDGGVVGYYWSSTIDDSNKEQAFMLSFDEASFRPKVSVTGVQCNSVRLVKDLAEEEDKYLLNVSVNQESWGFVTNNNVPFDQKQMKAGESVTLTAEAYPGYRFVKWILEGEGSSISEESKTTTTFTMGTSAATLTAEFEVKPSIFTINIEPAEGGEVRDKNDQPIDGGEIKPGDVITLTAVANPEYEFDHWTIAYEGNPEATTTSTEKTYNLTRLDNSDVTVMAYFKIALKVEVSPKGSGIVQDQYLKQIVDTMLYEGETIILKAVEATGFRFARWEYSDGADVIKNGNEITFKMGTTGETLRAIFEPITTTAYYTLK